MVPGAGIEPARLSAGDFESRADFNVYVVSMWFFPQKNSDEPVFFIGRLFFAERLTDGF